MGSSRGVETTGAGARRAARGSSSATAVGRGSGTGGRGYKRLVGASPAGRGHLNMATTSGGGARRRRPRDGEEARRGVARARGVKRGMEPQKWARKRASARAGTRVSTRESPMASGGGGANMATGFHGMKEEKTSGGF